MGIDLEIEETPSFEGCEFFSHRFYTVKHGVSAIPTRFTKHIENLKRATPGMEADALASLMTEWVWDDAKFEFFHELYMNCRKKYVEDFPLKYLINRDITRLHLNGVEVAM